MKKDMEFRSGVGLDIGTMNVLSARRTTDGRVATVRVRDAFIDLDPEVKRSLRLTKISYVEKNGNVIVLGDDALNMANMFKREVRRPLSKGVVSPGETEAQEILSLLVEKVLGERVVMGEHCYYSVPASPIDDPDQDVVYHTEIFRKIISEYGYTPHPTNEAVAIVYSQCAAENFSGLSLSFGAGMTNVALVYQTVKGMSFSLSRGGGGDWVDLHAAKALGSTSARVCLIKEKGVNLAKPTTREEEAIALYIRTLIRYCLENITMQFRRDTMNLPDPIPLVISGGTSKAGGFLEVFKDEFAKISQRGFPIQISEIRAATDPMTAVAEGLLVLATEEE